MENKLNPETAFDWQSLPFYEFCEKYPDTKSKTFRISGNTKYIYLILAGIERFSENSTLRGQADCLKVSLEDGLIYPTKFAFKSSIVIESITARDFQKAIQECFDRLNNSNIPAHRKGQLLAPYLQYNLIKLS
jgi:hypothetical protein